MWKIGEFARLGRTTIKAVRHYDEIGLLKATHIDPVSGYRYYSLETLERLTRIRALQDAGLPLREIRRVLDDELSDDDFQSLLRNRRVEIAGQIAHLQAQLARLDRALSKKEEVITDHVVTFRALREGEAILFQPPVIHEQPSFPLLPLPTNKGMHVFVFNIRTSGVAQPDLQHIDDGEELTNESDVMFTTTELPTIEGIASTLHYGEREGIVAAYRALHHWMLANDYLPAAPPREIRSEGEAEVIEVQFPVMKRPQE